MTIANDNCLLPRLSIQYALDIAFTVAGENMMTQTDTRDAFDRRRTKRVYISPDGLVTRAGNPHIQKVRIGFIDTDGNSHRWGSDFPEKMYLRFINIKSDSALDRFIEKTGFCIFPSISETEILFKEYKKRKLDAPRVFLPRRESDEKRNHDLMEIFLVNKEFISKKRNELRDMVEQYTKGTLRYDKLLWINQQMENISDVLIDGKHFIWDEIKQGVKGEVAKDQRKIEGVLGLETIKEKTLIPALRTYGYYAYCCYEFFLDVLEKNAILVCKNCERYFHPDRKGQSFCKDPWCANNRREKYRTVD